MIRYRYKKAEILFVGINPHPGSFDRGVPFSNNKLFWYLLSGAGLIKESRDELRNDAILSRVYRNKFNAVYHLGFVNIIDRPTRDITAIEKGEEVPGRKKVSRIIRREVPMVVCFVGRVAYEKFIGSKNFAFGWQGDLGASKAFVMHFPLRGPATVRLKELRQVKRASRAE